MAVKTATEHKWLVFSLAHSDTEHARQPGGWIDRVVDYLTVLSVEQLKALNVLQLNTFWQRLPLQVNIGELWEGTGCICKKEQLQKLFTETELGMFASCISYRFSSFTCV